ncbi:MAG: hypothetical protein ACI85O_001552 [Saprospiraceae bacterium]|jgi:hypothetical protein
MKKIVILLLLCFISLVGMQAQDGKFTVTVSTDSILMDNQFQVSFTLENVKGTEFEAPSFGDFNVLTGPNMSSSFSMMNGAVTQTVSYTYILRPKDIGNYFIEPASIKTGETYLETAPLEVMVVPNPDGIIQKPQIQKRSSPFGAFEDMFESSDFLRGMPSESAPRREEVVPKKKKRKTYRL